MAEETELTEVITIRTTQRLRARLTKWREKTNKTAPNPLNESDALRVALSAGLDRLESD